MSAPIRRPNVVVFFTDQQRWDTIGLNGNPLDLTPNLDRMGMEGTFVPHAFTCQPVCGPARACLQTGKYATTVGCHVNGIPLPENETTLAHHFKNAGYHTGYIGKWHLHKGEPVPEGKRGGYEYWLAANILEFTSDAYHTVLYDNDDNPVTLPGYRVDALTDAAIRYIDNHKEHPFFLFLSFIEPHFQNHRDDYPAPYGYAERYVSRWIPPDLAALGGNSHQHLGGYCGMIKRLDEALGRLLDALRSLQLLEDTIVIFTSDHGNHFRTRNSEYKRSPHDSSIRIPMAMHGGPFSGGGRVRELVSLIDIPPTLLDAAGIPVPPEMQGRSMLPLLRGEREDWPGEVFVQISESQIGRAIRTHRWKYAVQAPKGISLRNPSSDTYEEACLYDLQADPYELTNLIGFASHKELAKALRERLIKRMAEAGEAIPEIIAAPELPAKQRKVYDFEINL
jgi:arylsulfatase A-like enzyme